MKCGTCRPGRGCCSDFSSRSEQLPSLGAIDIVDGIFRQALRNLAKRLAAVRAGEMSGDELNAANEKLVLWLGAVLSGRSRHFDIVDPWHPEGLAEELMRIFGRQISVLPTMTDEEVIAEAGRLFVREGEDILTAALEAGYPASSAAEIEPAVILAARWANLFAGALVEEEA